LSSPVLIAVKSASSSIITLLVAVSPRLVHRIPMNHDDHLQLIANGIEAGSDGVWADFGAGTGAFTLALRDLAGPATEIYAVDRDSSALRSLQAAFDRQFPDSRLHLQTADFTRPLDLPPLDGILAANSIHFVRDHITLVRQWRRYLKPDGRLVLVEYDTDDGNRWVPYPVSFSTLSPVARAAGFSEPLLLGSRGSRFLDRMYAAAMTPAPSQAEPLSAPRMP
jgi:SAM-dependent methyltransferase